MGRIIRTMKKLRFEERDIDKRQLM